VTDLDELSRLLKQATPGPWLVDAFNATGGYDCMYGSHDIVTENDRIVLELDQRHYDQDSCDFEYRSPEAAANAALIAALRNAAEELVRDARRLAYLESFFSPMGLDANGNHPWMCRNNPARLRGPNLRAAIDAAIAQEQP
jgi:hypothetical protein